MGSPNLIAIQVTDGIAPSIAPNLQKIATSARDAESGLSSLKAALTSLNSGNITGLGQSLRSVSSATTQLKNTTAAFGNTASTVAKQIVNLASSYNTLDFAVQSVIKTLSTFTAVAGTARLAAGNFGSSTRNAGAGARGSISPVQAASAAIRVLEGNFGTSVRAAERFLVTTLNLGNVLKFAFPVFGAIALIGVFNILESNIQRAVEAYKRLDAAAIQAEASAIRAGEKVLRVKPELGFLSAERAAELVKGGGPLNEDITIKNSQAILRQLSDQRRLAEAQERANEAGLQGNALQQQRVRDLQEQKVLVEKQRDTVKGLADEYERLYASTHKVTRTTPSATGFGNTTFTQDIPNLTEAQRKAVGEQLRQATQAAFDLDTEVKVLGFDIQAAMKREPIAKLKDEMKAAREQMKEFRTEMGGLKQQNRVVNPEEIRDLLQAQLDIALPENSAEINSQLGAINQTIERRNSLVDQAKDRLLDQVSSIGEYSDALRIKNSLDRIELQFQKENIPLSNQQKDSMKELLTYTIGHAAYQKELRGIYEQFNEPFKTYQATLQAVNKLEKDGAITHEQGLIAQAQANKTYNDAIFPLNEYAHGLQNQIDLLGKYGTALRVATEVQSVQEQLRQKGRTLNAQEVHDLTTQLTQLEKQKTIQQTINQLYEENIGQLEKLTLAYAGITRARKEGIISQEQETVELAKLKVKLAEVQLQIGKGTAKDVLTATIGDYIKQFQGFTKETTRLYQDVFRTIADGAAESLGRALVYGEDLGKALKDVARQALSELISGFIKLGIQMLVTAIIGKTAGSAAVAQTVADAAAAAVAWAPAAAFASLATLGANAAPAEFALSATVGLAELLAALSNVGHFNKGGVVGGFGNSDSIPAFLTPGEFVMRKQAVNAYGLATLQAMNNGARGVQGGSSRPMIVNVQHDGTTGVHVQQISADEVRIIARQESKSAVENHGPRVVAQDILQPNSHTSKAIGRSFETNRRR